MIMMRNLSWRRLSPIVRVGVPLAAVALLIAACANSGTNSSGSSGGSATTSGSGTVDTHSGPMGTYLTDKSGKTLYMFQADKSGMSSCTGACAAAWPPMMVSGTPTAGGDAKSSDLGTIKRPDGTTQATYAGHPLYFYAGDSSAGQTNGQGINQFGALWYIVGPSGSAITASGGASSPSGSGGGGGWS